MNAPARFAAVSNAQAEVLDSGLLQSSGVLMLPTTGGKTWLAKIACTLAVESGHKAVYLCPLRALAKELGRSWREDLGSHGLGVYTGEVGVDALEDNPAPSEAGVLIMTAEKFDLYVRQWSEALSWLSQVDLVVVDELHTLDDGRRGATLEGVITRLRSINPFVRFLGLSATLGNPRELAQWLGGTAFVSQERAVPLTWSISPYKKSEDKVDCALAEIEDTTSQNGQVIVFVQSRPRAESLAAKVRAAGFTALPHHAGLSPAVRERCEASFRARQLQVIVATPTLAVGVNLPARKVIVYDLSRWENGGFTNLSCCEVWQLGGRAGRVGLDVCGQVVLLAPKWNQKAARGYLAGKFEAIKSELRLGGPAFVEQVLVTIGSRIALNSAQAARVIQRSFWGSSLTPQDVGRKVAEATEQMVAAAMLEQSDKGYLRATRLGRIAVRFQLSPQGVIAWGKVPTILPNATFMDLLMLVCGSPDFTAKLRTDATEIESLAESLAREPLTIGGLTLGERHALLPLKGRELASAAKTALALRAWTRLGNDDEAGQSVGCLGHEVQEARKEAVRLLQAMLALLGPAAQDGQAGTVVAVVVDGSFEPCLDERIRALSAMVCAGLDHESATLALVDGIGPILARRLIEHGVRDIEDLALAEPADLATMEGLSLKRATRWVNAAGDLVSLGGAMRYGEIAGNGMEPVPTRPRLRRGLDPHRWERARLLSLESGDDGWIVSGGSEPHMVVRHEEDLACDCADAARGRLCKHQIKVLAHLQDPGIPNLEDDYPDWGGAVLDLVAECSGTSRGRRFA